MAPEPTGARARGVGAIARGDGPHRRRGLWWLLGGLVAAAIIAAILIAVLSGGSHHAKTAARGAGAAASATAAGAASTSTGAAAAPATSQTTAGGAGSAASGAAALTGTGQVGGGGVTARAATGRLAPAGSVGDVLFAEDGTVLDTNAQRVVATAVTQIQADHARSVTVVGYTDTIGNAKANHTLSLERARAVAAAIRTHLASKTTQFSVQARGASHPVASNRTAQGRQLDRRVTIFVKQ